MRLGRCGRDLDSPCGATTALHVFVPLSPLCWPWPSLGKLAASSGCEESAGDTPGKSVQEVHYLMPKVRTSCVCRPNDTVGMPQTWPGASPPPAAAACRALGHNRVKTTSKKSTARCSTNGDLHHVVFVVHQARLGVGGEAQEVIDLLLRRRCGPWDDAGSRQRRHSAVLSWWVRAAAATWEKRSPCVVSRLRSFSASM